ncbi:MAG: hypothetical protein IPM48_11825 [Saprospiraceae bacterium]|nr:hypothetical protein [Saprospiraceae bacterium]
MIKAFKTNPLVQSGICILIVFCGTLLFIGLRKWLPQNFESLDIWTLTTSMLLFYILFNISLGMNQEHKLIYYRNSIYGYALLLFIGIMVGKWASGVSVFEAKTYSWIIFVFSFVYLLFLSLASLIRKIIQIALKQEQKLRNENH